MTLHATPPDRESIYLEKLATAAGSPIVLRLSQLEDVARQDLAQAPSDHAAIMLSASRVACVLMKSHGLPAQAADRISIDFALLLEGQCRIR